MPEPMHPSLPGVTGDISTVPAATGTLVVDTGLMDVQSFSAGLAQDSVATAAGVSWEFVAEVPGTTRKVTLKTWAADGATAGSTAAKVSWIAMGR